MAVRPPWPRCNSRPTYGRHVKVIATQRENPQGAKGRGAPGRQEKGGENALGRRTRTETGAHAPEGVRGPFLPLGPSPRVNQVYNAIKVPMC